jgi:putative hydrolase of the HAD superfamily
LPEVSHVLEKLQRKNRLAIASNSQRLFTLPELRKYDIERYFSCLVFSSDVRACKPSPKVFTEVCRIMKVHPQRTIFVGDNLFDDIWGAKRIGMKTVWVNRDGVSGLPAGHERPAPDRELTGLSYRELPEIIRTLEACTS